MTNKIKNRIQKSITIVLLLSFLFSNTGILALATEPENMVIDDVVENVILPSDVIADLEDQLGQTLATEEEETLTLPLDFNSDEEEIEEETVEDAPIPAPALVPVPVIGDEDPPDRDFINAPFLYQYDQGESISLNTGALSITVTDLILPGKNGLDLVISRSYDSSEGSGSPYTYETNNGSKSIRFNSDGDARGIMDSFLGDKGWRFNFSWIEQTGSVNSGTDRYYLHLAKGGVYEYKTSSWGNLSSNKRGDYYYLGYSNLKNYTLEDIRLVKGSNYYDGSKYASWTLSYADGKKEFFDEKGRLMAIQDRFDNTIKFAYSLDYYPNVEITDTAGRQITISGQRSNYDQNNPNMLMSATIQRHGDTDPLITYSMTQKQIGNTTGSFRSVLENVAMHPNTINRVTEYIYSVAEGAVIAGSYGQTINYFLNLTNIIHPTEGRSVFDYDDFEQGFSGGTQVIYKVLSRWNLLNNSMTKYNKLDFAYADHFNNTVSPSYTYNYSTSIINSDGLKEEHMFLRLGSSSTGTADKHLNTKTVYSDNGTKYEEVNKAYNFDTLPVWVEKIANTGSSTIQSVEVYEYDKKGNVTAYWDPQANGNKFDVVHKKTFMYDSTYNLPTKTTYSQSETTHIEEIYELSNNKKTVTSKKVNTITGNIRQPAWGAIYSWGWNGFGQLGDGAYANKLSPTLRVGDFWNDVQKIATGYNFTIALKNDGTVWAMGANSSGQLGTGNYTISTNPVKVINLDAVIAISAGYGHSLALRADGTVWAWGLNSSGQLGNGYTTNSAVPVKVSNLTNVKAIAAGGYHNLALKDDGAVWAWGNNTYGQLGYGTNILGGPLPSSTTPVLVGRGAWVKVYPTWDSEWITVRDVTSIAAGGYHSSAISEGGTMIRGTYVWGGNNYGQLGHEYTFSQYRDRTTPYYYPVYNGTHATAAGAYHSLSVRWFDNNDTTPTVNACGSNSFGQFGDSYSFSYSAFDDRVLVSNHYLEYMREYIKDSSGVGVYAGENTCFAIKRSTGALWSWGQNNYGQLGRGSATPTVLLPASTGFAGFATMTSSSFAHHSFAFKNNTITPNLSTVLVERTDFIYDTVNPGNVKYVDCYTNPSVSSNCIRTEYSYDKNNTDLPASFNGLYCTSETVTGVKNADGGNASGTVTAGTIKKTYKYDYYGNLCESMDGKSANVIKRDYDDLNRLEKITNPDGSYKEMQYNDTLNTTTVFYEDYNIHKEKEIYSYDDFGNLRTVEDEAPNGAKTIVKHLEYDNNFRIVKEHTPLGTTTNEYDKRGRLKSVAKKVAPGDPSSAELYKESYLYEDAVKPSWSSSLFGRVTKTIDGNSTTSLVSSTPSLITVSYTDKMGRVVQAGRKSGTTEYLDEYTYDYLGNKLTEKTAFTKAKHGSQPYTNKWEYDYAGQVTKHFDPNAYTATIIYDGLGRKISATDYKNNMAEYTYDSLNRLIKEVTPLLGADEIIKKYYYDATGNVTKESVRREANTWDITEYQYNNRNSLISVQSGNDYLVYKYDTMGRIIQQSTGASGIDTLGNPLGSPAMTNYDYDWSGTLRTVTETDPLGYWEKSSFNAQKLLKQVQDRNNAITVCDYDALSRLKQKTTSSSSDSITYSINYTKTGDIASEVDWPSNVLNAVWLNYTYDSFGRMVETSEACASELNYVTKVYNYDFFGDQLLGFILGLNGTQQQKTTYSGYDKAGRPKTVTEVGNSNNTLSICDYDYDNNGNIKTVTYKNSSGTVINTESIAYNNANMVTSVTNRKGTTTTGQELSKYTYDYYLDGNQKSKTATIPGESIKTTVYAYDTKGRLQSETEKVGINQTWKAVYDYDDRDNRTKLTVTGSENYTTEYDYDNNNRLLWQEKTQGEQLGVTTYTYDPNGNTLSENVVTFSGPLLGDVNMDGIIDCRDATMVLQAYVELIPPLTLEQFIRADVNEDGVADIVDAALIFRMAEGMPHFGEWIASIINSNIHERKCDYCKKSESHQAGQGGADCLLCWGRGTPMGLGSKNAESLENAELGEKTERTEIFVDNESQPEPDSATEEILLSSLEDDTKTGLPEFEVVVDKNERSLFELIEELLNTSDRSLIIDQLKKALTTPDGETIMSRPIVEATSQLSIEVMGEAGNQGELTLYTYDLFGRQVGVQKSDMTASYAYNPNGLRAGSTITGGMGSNGSGSVTTKYIWNGQNIVAELDGSNNVTATYTRGHNLISQRRGSTSQFYLYNGHGDVVQLTDTDGNMVKNYSYDAFGVEKDPDPNDTNIWRYAGEMYDKDTETYYLRARYYTPGTGRFLTGDTYWNSNNMIYGDGGNATPNLAAIRQSSNLYIFCINNPLMFIDPSGYKIKLSSNATDVEKREYERAIAYLKNSEDGKKLIEKLEKADEIILITFISNHDDGYTGSKDGTKRTIEWDPTSGLLMSDGTSIQSAALGLAHEMGHAAQHLDGAYFSFKTNDAREANNLEKYEKPIAKQLGEPIRARFENELGGYRMNNSTHYRTTHTRSWYDYIAPWNWGKPKTYTKDHNAK